MLGTHTLTHSLTHTLTHRTTAIPSLLACGGEGNKNKSSKQIISKRYYKLKYLQNPQKARERSAVNYSQNAEHIKQRAREYSAVSYSQNPELIRQRAREHSAVIYSQNLSLLKKEQENIWL